MKKLNEKLIKKEEQIEKTEQTLIKQKEQLQDIKKQIENEKVKELLKAIVSKGLKIEEVVDIIDNKQISNNKSEIDKSSTYTENDINN